VTPHQPGQQNSVTGAGIVVVGGVISDSPMTVVSGDSNVITNQPGRTSDDAVLAAAQRELSTELARIRKALLEDDDKARAAHREEAIEAVSALQTDLGEPAVVDHKTLRTRINALLEALQPVAGIIGGIAALEAIVRGL
jgi:hypothetical protein